MSTTTTPNMPSPQGVPPSTPPDLSAVKAKQQAAWSAGDYAIIGRTLQIVGENLCEAVNLRAGERVLDVAAGNGNATLAAARHFAEVTSTDYVPGLLERGRARAEAEGLQVTFREADAEALLPEMVPGLAAEQARERKRHERRGDQHDAARGRAAQKLLEGGKDAPEERFERVDALFHGAPVRRCRDEDTSVPWNPFPDPDMSGGI